MLEDYGLVEKVGPTEHSGFYEITTTGKGALVYQDQYDEVDDFYDLGEEPDPETVLQDSGMKASFARGEDEKSDNK